MDKPAFKIFPAYIQMGDSNKYTVWYVIPEV
jgi:hypothetical protein